MARSERLRPASMLISFSTRTRASWSSLRLLRCAASFISAFAAASLPRSSIPDIVKVDDSGIPTLEICSGSFPRNEDGFAIAALISARSVVNAVTRWKPLSGSIVATATRSRFCTIFEMKSRDAICARSTDFGDE